MCFRILVLLYFAIKETPQHYNSTATVSVQDSSPRSEFGVVVFVLSSCEVLENTGKAKVSMNFKNVQKSITKHFSAIAKQRCYPLLKTLWQSPVFVLNFIVSP